MSLSGATLLLLAALAADEGRPERVLVVAPRPPASQAVVALTQAISSQLARSGRRVVVPDSALRKALEETHSPPLTDLDDPAQIALALQLVDADYLVSVLSARTLIVRSVGIGRPSGRLVATAGGEPADVAMDLVRQLDRPLESPAIAPPPPLPRIGDRVALEFRVLGGGWFGSSRGDQGEYGVSLGFEAPFASRWAVSGSVGLRLGTVAIDIRKEDQPAGLRAGFTNTSFRLPVGLEFRWAFLKGGNWIAQAALGAEVAYVGLETWDSYGLTVGPSLALQLGYSLSERFQVRVGARYVASVFASEPSIAVDAEAPDGTFGPVHLVPSDRLHHEVQGFVAIDLNL